MSKKESSTIKGSKAHQVSQALHSGKYELVLQLCQAMLSQTLGPSQEIDSGSALSKKEIFKIHVWQATASAKLRNWEAVSYFLTLLPRSYIESQIDCLVLQGLASLSANEVQMAFKSFKAVLALDKNHALAATSISAIKAATNKQALRNSKVGTQYKKKGLGQDPAMFFLGTKPKVSSFNNVGEKTTASLHVPKRKMPSMLKRTPVVIISGFLGAGKTTLLHHILNQTHLRVAVIVNDMASLNVDAHLTMNMVQNSKSTWQATSEANVSISRIKDLKVVELTNGCICCTLRDDLARQIFELSTYKGNDSSTRQSAKYFDYIFVESTGISEPLPVAQIFLLPISEVSQDKLTQQVEHLKTKKHAHQAGDICCSFNDCVEGKKQILLNDVAYVDALISVVDASNFWKDFSSSHKLRDRDWESTPVDNRSVVELLTAQVNFIASCSSLNSFNALHSILTDRNLCTLRIFSLIYVCRLNTPI